MTRYPYEDPVSPDFSHPWIQRRLEQLEAHFDFSVATEGRFYVLFGGHRAGKTSLLKIIHERFPPEPETATRLLSVFIDLAAESALQSSEDVFRLLFERIREQLGVCYIDPNKLARLFETSGSALPDFKDAFDDIVRSPESTVGGARIVLLLDNADALAQEPFGADLFSDLIRLYSNATYIRHVTSQLDTVVTGGVPLYNLLAETRFPRKLKHWYNIETLPKDAAQALIAYLPAIQNQPDLVEQVMRFTGRQPYLLQFFMSQLEDMTSRGEALTSEVVAQVANACLEPRSEPAYWFHACVKAIEEQGARSVYAVLSAGQPMTWSQIRTAIEQLALGDATWLRDPIAVDMALDVLCYHGLVQQQQVGATSGFLASNELFRQWFVNNMLSEEEMATIVVIGEEGLDAALKGIAAEQDLLKDLAELLDERFNEEELRMFCFNLDVDYDNLEARGKANKARELVLLFKRRNDIPTLLETGKRLRPDISWP